MNFVTTFTARLLLLLALLLGLTATGCKRSLPTAEVEGVLLIDGKAARKVQVHFIPIVEAGVKAPMSSGETDDQGRFVLSMFDSDSNTARPGAVVGKHSVTLTDLQMSESATGRGVPMRFKSEYMLPSTTPLTQVIGEGKQSIEIRIP